MNPLAIITYVKANIALLLNIIKVVAVVVVVYLIYHSGETRIQTKWDKSIAEGEIAKEKLKVNETKVTADKEIEYVTKIKTVTIKGEKQIEYIDRYITPDIDAQCVIPNNIIMLHDSAIAASIITDSGDQK